MLLILWHLRGLGGIYLTGDWHHLLVKNLVSEFGFISRLISYCCSSLYECMIYLLLSYHLNPKCICRWKIHLLLVIAGLLL